MKKLAYLIIIISLPLLIFFQYRSYMRFNPPNSFGFIPSDGIDTDYHNPALLKTYYQLVYEIPAFARSQWSNNGVDVRYPEDNPDEREAAAYYNQQLAMVNLIEDKLQKSYNLKQQGFGNAAIRKMEEEGLSIKEYRLLNTEDLIGIKKGDRNSAVWELQKHLLEHGYEIPKDGIFDVKTEDALKDLQSKNDQFPSGIVDKSILPLLIKD